jgi:hypothetical protein
MPECHRGGFAICVWAQGSRYEIGHARCVAGRCALRPGLVISNEALVADTDAIPADHR